MTILEETLMNSTAQTVDAMLADVAFAAPVTVQDCEAVYLALKEALKARAPKVEVFCNTDEYVVIRVYSNGEGEFTRKVKVCSS
jgi:hypothetical protein